MSFLKSLNPVWWIGLGTAAITLVLAVVLFRPGESGRADPTDAAQVALGRTVYEAQCASCHGTRLEGQANWRVRRADGKLPAPPHDATGHTWHHPDKLLFRITKYGPGAVAQQAGYRTDMPAYDDALTDREIWAVLAYIKSRWPAAIRARQEAIDRGAAR